jgi:Bacterial regulatory proteins, luxR family
MFVLLWPAVAALFVYRGHDMSCQDLDLLPDRPSPGLLRGAPARHSPRHAPDTGEGTGTPDYWEPPVRVRSARHASPAEPLTEREIEVLGLLPGFLPLREIAAGLSLSPNTITTHIWEGAS